MPLSRLATLSFFICVYHPLPALSEVCDITTEQCWNDGKCNIKFKNKTGESSGSAKNTGVDQSSKAQTITIKAARENGDAAGNKLTITAGASKTMNVENKYKKDFHHIRIKSGGTDESVSLKCGEIKKVLRGNGNCNITRGYRGETNGDGYYTLAYSCDNTKVAGF
ncbi:MAG: hypothetical protein AAFV37_14895 [Pseudomonadota bacterium]